MGRPKGGKNRVYSYEFKLSLMKELEAGNSSYYLGKLHDIMPSTINAWARKYVKNGSSALKNKRKPGNPMGGAHFKKFSSEEERLRYELALKEVEIMKLKKLIKLQRKEESQNK